MLPLHEHAPMLRMARCVRIQRAHAYDMIAATSDCCRALLYTLFSLMSFSMPRRCYASHVYYYAIDISLLIRHFFARFFDWLLHLFYFRRLFFLLLLMLVFSLFIIIYFITLISDISMLRRFRFSLSFIFFLLSFYTTVAMSRFCR